MKTFLLLFFVAFSISCSQTIKGEIYITSNTGENMRVGDASVSVFTEKDFQEAKAKSPVNIDFIALFEAERECRKWARFEAKDLFEPNYASCRNKSNQQTLEMHLNSLPSSSLAVTTATTNANGEFTVILPTNGEFVVVAQATRPSNTGYNLPYLFISSANTKDGNDFISISGSSIVNSPQETDAY